MRKLILLPILALIAVGITSCSPEAKLEKRLDGEWTITKMNVTSLENGQQQFTLDIPNPGTLSLERKEMTGMLKFDYVIDFGGGFKQTVKEDITITKWVNTDVAITLTTKNSSNVVETNKFVIKTNEKKTQVWEMTVVETQGGVETKDITTVYLTKK